MLLSKQQIAKKSLESNAHWTELAHSKKHLTKAEIKLETRNNTLQKFCEITSEASAFSFGLLFQLMNNVRPHVHSIDAQLNNTMRTIAGGMKSTPTERLSVVSQIPPPHPRRNRALNTNYKNILKNRSLPIHEEINHALCNCLRSRKSTIRIYLPNRWNVINAWHEEWTTKQNKKIQFITTKPPGFDLA